MRLAAFPIRCYGGPGKGFPMTGAAGSLDLQSVGQALRDLPWGAHAAAGAALVGGLVLWLFGRRVIRPIFVLLGAAGCATIGFFALPAAGVHEVGGVPSTTVGLAGGGIVGAIVAAALFRLVMGVTSALVFGLAGVLVAATLLGGGAPAPGDGVAPTSPPDAPAPATMTPDGEQPGTPADADGQSAEPDAATPAAGTSPADQAAADASDEPADAGPTILERASDRARRFLGALRAEAGSRWGALPTRTRFAVVLAGLAGVVAGLALGTVLPAWSAGAVTAMFGAAVWLPSLHWLASVLEVPGRHLLDRGALGWLLIWFGVSAVGMTAQWSGLGRRRARPAPVDGG